MAAERTIGQERSPSTSAVALAAVEVQLSVVFEAPQRVFTKARKREACQGMSLLSVP
jgi:hypothetical protein